MKAQRDFNYNVALADGLKKLQAGRLREAETQFRFLIDRFPANDGGYRGLAKVLVELEDRAAALVVLRDGASAMAKAGSRAGAITMLRDAVGLDAMDLSAHRRLVAAYSLNGDEAAAGAEVARYVAVVPDIERQRMEVAYALERLPNEPQVLALAQRLNVEVVRAAPVVDEETVTVDERLVALADQQEPTPPRPPEPEPVPPPPPEPPKQRAPEPARVAAEPPPVAAVSPLDEARAHLAAGHLNAASDVLLELIATGQDAHEAQRLLVEVARGLGRRDLADAKKELLVQVERL